MISVGMNKHAFPSKDPHANATLIAPGMECAVQTGHSSRTAPVSQHILNMQTHISAEEGCETSEVHLVE